MPKSVIHSVQEWTWFQRKVWFYIIIDDKLFIYWLLRPCVRHYTRSSHLRELLVVTGFPILVCCMLNEVRGTFWLSDLVFRRAFRCIRIPNTASWYQIHHRLWFCCDSFFTWILLRPFRHYFRTIGRTEISAVEQTQKMIPFHHVWNFPCSVCLRVGSWCQCTWYGFRSPNWFYRTTNQEQLCGFWKRVSLSDFFLCDHLDHCFVVFKDKQQSFLMRSWRLREHNQCYPAR